MRRVLFVQYTSPGMYPPIVRAARLLADAGCAVRLLGVAVRGADALGVPQHPSVTTRLLAPPGDGWRLKTHYVRYASWVLRDAMRWRPDWLYASDLLSAPVALAVRRATGARVVYHEHDVPSRADPTWTYRRCLSARRALLTRADVCVAPNEHRAARLAALRPGRAVQTVWNCPLRESVRPPADRSDGALRVIFQGSINRDRVPLTLVEALARLPEHVTLTIAGYETSGSRGYIDELVGRASRSGISGRLHILGAMPQAELARLGTQHDVGLAFMPVSSRDENMRFMTGASNKVFEYLASGVVPLVTDLGDWRDTFVDPGYALACDPRNAASIAAALAWADGSRGTLRAIGERGRRRLLEDWNYEAQFAPVLRAIAGPAGPLVTVDSAREAACAS